MAEIKITAMGAASTPLAGTELLTAVQSGANVKVAASDVAAAFATDAANILPVANGGTGVATLTGYVKGSGTSDFTAAATVPFNEIANWAYASFCDVTDQSGSISAETAVEFGTTVVAGAGVTIANDGGGNPTQITFTAAGTYFLTFGLQFSNSGASDYDATVWLQLNGTNIANSATIVTVPKTGDGGNHNSHTSWQVTATAGQAIKVMWLPENASVTLNHTAAAAGPPTIPAIPSAVVTVQRIA